MLLNIYTCHIADIGSMALLLSWTYGLYISTHITLTAKNVASIYHSSGIYV